MGNNKEKSKRNPRTIALLIVAAVLLGSMGGGLYALMNTKIFEEKPNEILDSGPHKEQTEQFDEIPEEDEIVDEAVNFLIIGVDESEMLTDVMMIARLNTKDKSVNIIQIPRDTYVGDDTVITGKINSVYSHPDKGDTSINTLKKAIKSKLKINVDHYATITLDKFRDVVDILGGVPIDIKQDIYWDEYTTLEEGKHVLTGHEAEIFIRYRKGYATGDIGRMGATKQFMESLIDMMFEMSAGDAVKIAGSCYNKITTDLTINDIIKYYNIIKKMDKDNIEFFIIPGDGVSEKYNGYSIYAVDVVEYLKILNAHFRAEDSDKLTKKDIPLDDVNDIKESLDPSYKPQKYSSELEENGRYNNANNNDDDDDDDNYSSKSSSSSSQDKNTNLDQGYETVPNSTNISDDEDDYYDSADNYSSYSGSSWDFDMANDSGYEEVKPEISSSSSRSSSGATSSGNSSSGSFSFWNEDGSFNSSSPNEFIQR